MNLCPSEIAENGTGSSFLGNSAPPGAPQPPPDHQMKLTLRTHSARVLPLVLCLGMAYASFNNAYTPPFRGQVDSEYSGWETFTIPFNGPNLPDVAGTSSDDAVLTQTTPGAILTSTGNIYNPAGPSHFVLSDTLPEDMLEVVLQISAFGVPADYGSFVLSYTDGSGQLISLPPDSIQNLWNAGGSFEDRFDWDLSGNSDSITNYTIQFDASAMHMSLDAVILDVRFDGGAIGTNYCGANVNSTGTAAFISATGSDAVIDNDLTLHMNDVPMNQFGYFINGLAQGFVPNPGGSAGNLCISGAIGRHSAQAANSGTSGSISVGIDLTAIPRPSGGPVAVQPGETWYFQGWFRDSGTSNFTDGIAITFQ